MGRAVRTWGELYVGGAVHGGAVLSIYQVKVSQGLSVVCGLFLQQVVSAAVLSLSHSLSLSLALSRSPFVHA